jgi:D-3-phosphoglycerate dehydrogenase / 2-oxoglutarate reductase
MTQRWRVVATGPWDAPGWQAPLEKAGCEVVLGSSFDRYPGQAYSEPELIALLRDADAALVSTRERISRQILEASPRLKIVAKATIGVEKIDLEAAADLGILVVNSPAPENFLGVAEATVGLILALVKRLPTSQSILREGRWKQRSELGSLLRGKTIGIIGLGRVGSNVARRLTGWDLRLLAYDPYVEPAPAYAVGAELVSLDTLVQEADVITLHVVLTNETRHMINEARLRAMKPTAYLVNTSRGEAIDEAALAKAIEEGWISGAALDVFEDEPLPLESPLRRLDPERLILTPHCIGNNAGSQATGTRMAVENILSALRGDRPSYIKNPAALPRWRERWAMAAAT